jgi:GNAT superfamily N-acetyltransferase
VPRRSTPEHVAHLLAATLPDEELSADELRATLFDDPEGDVLAADGGAGVVGVAVRGHTGFVTVIAVEPAAQRQGIGAGLLVWAHAWLQERGATEVRTGAAAPRYLWPGVDLEAHRAALGLFEAAGYEPVDENRNHRCATSFRAPTPEGVDLRRVAEGAADDTAVRGFVTAAHPWWLDEVARAVASGCCHGAFTADGAAVGFACHSVNRAGWIGPMATDGSQRGRGVGSALLGAVCADLDLAELAEAEIAWVGPDAFYEKAAATSVSRRFTVLARRL